MTFLPFDYLIVSNQYFDVQSLNDTFSFFKERGIRKFIFLIDFDPMRHSVAWIKDQQRRLHEILHSVRPRGITAICCINSLLTDGFVYDSSIDTLVLNHSSVLFVNLPIFCDQSWVDRDLNHLLFKKNYLPILTSFEANIRTNSKAHIDQILHSKAYRLSLDLNYLTAIDSEIRMMQIISREIPIFPCLSHDLSNYVGIDRAFDELKLRLGAHTYGRFCRNLLSSEKLLFH